VIDAYLNIVAAKIGIAPHTLKVAFRSGGLSGGSVLGVFEGLVDLSVGAGGPDPKSGEAAAVTLLDICTYVSNALIILAAVIALLTGVGVLGGWISWHCRDQEKRGPTL